MLPSVFRALLFVALLVEPTHCRVGQLEFEQDPVCRTKYVDTTEETVKFSVATYNVQARPLLDDVVPKFLAVGPNLSQFDIVALQECFTQHRLLWLSADHPARAHDGTRTEWWRPVASGLCTMARFPVRETIVKKFEQPPGLRFLFRDKKDGLASKGIMLTRFDLGRGRTLDFYNTHLEAGSDEESNEVRRKQARQLIDIVREQSPKEHAVIVAGDLNMRAPERKNRTLAPDYPRNFEGLSRQQIYKAITRELGLANAASISGESASSLIDHLLFRSGHGLLLEPLAWKIETRRFRTPGGQPWSDHDPVTATFRATLRP